MRLSKGKDDVCVIENLENAGKALDEMQETASQSFDAMESPSVSARATIYDEWAGF